MISIIIRVLNCMTYYLQKILSKIQNRYFIWFPLILKGQGNLTSVLENTKLTIIFFSEKFTFVCTSALQLIPHNSLFNSQ